MRTTEGDLVRQGCGCCEVRARCAGFSSFAPGKGMRCALQEGVRTRCCMPLYMLLLSVTPTWFLMFWGLRMGRYSDTLSQLLPCLA